MNFSGAPEERVQVRPIKAQSGVIARAMASICNAERVRLGRGSGGEREFHRLSDNHEAVLLVAHHFDGLEGFVAADAGEHGQMKTPVAGS